MSNGKLRHYVDVAISLLEEKKLPHIFIKAMGRAINKTVAIGERTDAWISRAVSNLALMPGPAEYTVWDTDEVCIMRLLAAEIVKRRIPGLHQQTELGSVSISE